MPEIAEAHTMAQQISVISGQKILTIDIYSDSTTKFSNLHLAKGKNVIDVFAHGKRVIIQLLDGIILTTLSMTGKWLLPCSHLSENISYCKLRLGFGKEYKCTNVILDGKKRTTKVNRVKGHIYFLDSRTWGSVKYLTNDEYFSEISKLGPDPLNNELNFEYFHKAITKPSINRRKVCKFLNDQAIIAGIGNYMRAEILYDAKINPFRSISTLTYEEIVRLYNSLIITCERALESNGLSISDTVGNYVTPGGGKGTFQKRVYGDHPFCPNGHNIERVKNGSEQTIHYCPVEQI